MLRFFFGLSFIFFGVVTVVSAEAGAKPRPEKIQMDSPVITRLDAVMSKANELRGALIQKKDPMVIMKIRELNLALRDALEFHSAQEKQHLDRILNEARTSLERVHSTQGEDRRQQLQETFKQIVLIGQTYKLNDSYRFFFCQKDRSVWMQKEGRPQNPINPDTLLNCATQVQ